MKKILLLILSTFMLTGCFENNKFNEVNLYTTIYPLEYTADYLYSDYGNIKSIYPNEIDINKYKLTKKQKEHYSNGKTFIYDGLSDEVKLAVEFLNKNSKLQIIDGMKNMNYKYGIEELWLDPSHYLMIARNIKESLIDYETSVYKKELINENYEDLKIKISEIDVDLTMTGKNAPHKNLLVANDTLLYLKKYGLNVISIDKNNETYEKNMSIAKELIANKELTYLYKLSNKELNKEVKTFVDNQELSILDINPIINLTEKQVKDNENYITLMNTNIDLIKKELLRKK